MEYPEFICCTMVACHFFPTIEIHYLLLGSILSFAINLFKGNGLQLRESGSDSLALSRKLSPSWTLKHTFTSARVTPCSSLLLIHRPVPSCQMGQHKAHRCVILDLWGPVSFEKGVPSRHLETWLSQGMENPVTLSKHLYSTEQLGSFQQGN